MNVVVRRPLLAACLLLLSLPAGPGTAGASPVGTAFTYQGTLLDDGAIPTAQYDFEVELYDDPLSGLSAGGPLLFDNVQVSEGLFQLELDFGAAFAGEQRWLELRVRDAASSGSFETLLPRQELTAAPQALFALTGRWSGLTGVPEGFDDEVDDDLLAELPCAAGEVPIRGASSWSCSLPGGGGGAGWTLTGNAGTIAGVNYLGTPDDVPLEIRVNGNRALHIESNVDGTGSDFNIVAGYATLGDFSRGVTIAGGGTSNYPNRAYSPNGTIGGGAGNIVGDTIDPDIWEFATVSGGALNEASGEYSAVSGGLENHAGGSYSWVGGGESNFAPGPFGTLGGGYDNFAAGESVTLGGGKGNSISGRYSFGGGGEWNVIDGEYAVIAGGGSNEAVADYATICGGGAAAGFGSIGNRVWNNFGTVGGGGGNQVGVELSDRQLHRFGTVAGGILNRASGLAATVGGGSFNRVHADYGVIAGGGASDHITLQDGNEVHDIWGSVLGGRANKAGAEPPNDGEGWFASVVGGQTNRAGGSYSFVGGGAFNRARSHHSVVAGGEANEAGDDLGDQNSTVAGGHSNRAISSYTVVGGGDTNLASGNAAAVLGGGGNEATGNFSTAGGGSLNAATGVASAILGGTSNDAAGDNSFVGGGFSNLADANFAAVGGGQMNQATGEGAFVGGGAGNIAAFAGFVGGGTGNEATGGKAAIGGGSANDATAPHSAIAGGKINLASGDASAIPGGSNNIAGCLNCFAAGSYSHAIHEGSFVWSDNSADVHTPSPAVRTFSVQASGGIWLGTNRSPSVRVGAFLDTSTGAYLSSVGVWESVSDRERKEAFSPIDSAELLEKVVGLPISSWSYIGDESGARHVGPMAQEFHGIFGVGSSDRTISPIDASGIALAAIQELAKRTAELQKALSLVGELEKRIAALEAAGGAR